MPTSILGEQPLVGDNVDQRQPSDLAPLNVSAEPANISPTCAHCTQKIADPYWLVVGGKTWHQQCLRCSVCKMVLDDEKCVWKAGNYYCRDDYLRLFQSCAGCNLEISSQDLVMSVADRYDYEGRVSYLRYHLKCFKCALCSRHLERGQQFFTQGTNLYCEQHFDICTSASPVLLPMAPLMSENIAGVDLMTSATSYVFGNELDDNVSKTKRNSTKASKTTKKGSKAPQATVSSPQDGVVPLSSSSPNETADLGQLQQTQQLNCELMPSVQSTNLHRSLTPPPQRPNQVHRPHPLVHRHSHQGLLSTVTAQQFASLPLGRSAADVESYLGQDSSVVGDYFSTTGSEYGEGVNQSSSVSSQQSGSGSHQQMAASQQQRGKRIRTSFKHTQLKIMKNYFQENHNPDAKDLKQLAAKTGLSKRVLQVWFQNARAKYRRNLLKEQQKQGGSGVLTFPGSFLPCGNTSLSDRAQSTSLLEQGDSPLSQNSTGAGGHDGLNGGMSSASMTLGGDDVDMMDDDDDELDDGFQEDEFEGGNRSRGTDKSPSSMAMQHLLSNHHQNQQQPFQQHRRHLSPSHSIMGLPNLGIDASSMLQQQTFQSSLAMTPPGTSVANSFNIFMDASAAAFAAASSYSTPPGTVDFNLGNIIQPTML